MPQSHLPPVLEVALGFVAPILPSVIGATIASAMKRELTWTDRVLQIFVGTSVSWYTRLAIMAICPMPTAVEEGLGFALGLIAAEAMPRLREKLIEHVVTASDGALDWAMAFIPWRRRK